MYRESLAIYRLSIGVLGYDGSRALKVVTLGAVAKCLPGGTVKRRYGGGVSKFLGFLLGAAVALAGPAVFGVLGAPGGIQLNTKEMALAYGVGALVFWAIVSYFSGAAAIGAFLAFGTLVYCWLWIPNRTTNFLDDVPGVTNGMVDGTRQYTLNGVVPILTVISLVYSIQLIVRSVQRRRRARVEAERLQREQEAAQAQQEAAAAAVYPVAASTYPAESYAAPSYEPSSRYDDLFDDEPEHPRNQADEQTAQFPVAESAPERTAAFSPFADDVADGNDETVLVPSDRDETVVAQAPASDSDEVTVIAAEHDETTQAAADEETREVEQAGTPAPADAADQTAVAEPAPADQETREVVEAAPRADGAGADDSGASGVGGPVASAPVPAAPTAPAASTPPAPAPGGPVVPAPAAPVASAPATPAPDAPAVPTPVASAPPAPAPEASAPVEDRDDERFDPPTGGGSAGGDETAVYPTEPEKPKAAERNADGGGWQAAEAFAEPVGGTERVGQQYRERMEDPEDTGEFHVSAFEGPFNTPGIRPAGA
jgi:hypothetical protein